MVPCADLPKLQPGAQWGDLVLDDAAIRRLYRKCASKQQGLIDHINLEMKGAK